MTTRIGIKVITGMGYAFVSSDQSANPRIEEAKTWRNMLDARDWLLKSGWSDEATYKPKYVEITYSEKDY